eukprot:TRINITY_DN25550_c0_g1_i1.p1 TRINITY_DN25550_c0_g1~~TRINITY_DN25550_c0_g1_i1.p1  ORF type:complete len:199 (+),score=92.53 TRINITY_DN25550_c0_g1_i1:72-599(+)
MSVMEFMQRIFPPGSMTPGMTKDDFAKIFADRLRAFEEGGFLEKTGMTPIHGEDDFLRRLGYHAQRKELMVVKYWKHGCIPCLSKAEMMKNVEQWCVNDHPGAAFYSIDIYHKDNLKLSDRQQVDGTPSIQKYFDYQQVGGEVRVSSEAGFKKNLLDTLHACLDGKCPRNMEPEY